MPKMCCTVSGEWQRWQRQLCVSSFSNECHASLETKNENQNGSWFDSLIILHRKATVTTNLQVNLEYFIFDFAAIEINGVFFFFCFFFCIYRSPCPHISYTLMNSRFLLLCNVYIECTHTITILFRSTYTEWLFNFGIAFIDDRITLLPLLVVVSIREFVSTKQVYAILLMATGHNT